MKHLFALIMTALLTLTCSAQDRPTPQLIAKAKAGDMDSAWILGELYRDGIGTAVDMQKAMDYFAMAAEPNNWQPQECAKECYLNILSDKGIDFEWTDKAWKEFDDIYAAKGYGWALQNVGVYYEFNDKARDLPMACDYYTRAAAKGDIIAAYRLGEANYSGLALVGNKKDHKAAAKYFQQVIDTRIDPDMDRKDLKSAACQRLSALYRFGRGVPENLTKANALMKQAEELGSRTAEEINKMLHIN